MMSEQNSQTEQNSRTEELSSHTSNHKQTSSPFFLHALDSPGSNLVSMVLTGDNYNSWSRAMTIALSAKNKMGFVTGDIQKPQSTDVTYTPWVRVNNMILSWILNSIHQDLVPTVLYTESVAEVWTDLRERFSPSNGPRIFHLEQKICTLEQGEDGITRYYNNLRRYWDELNNLEPLPNCSCEARILFVTQLENRRLYQFLMGLNPKYSNVVSQVLLMNPLPTVAKAYSLTLQDESQRHVHSTRSFTKNTLLTYGSMRNISPQTDLSLSASSHKHIEIASAHLAKRGPPSRARERCAHCGIPGHSRDVCFRLHGFPANYKERRRDWPPTKPSDNKPITNPESSSSVPPPPFTSEQYKQIIRLLQEVNIPKANLTGTVLDLNSNSLNSSTWVIDTGATNHITHNPESIQYAQAYPKPFPIVY